VSKINDALQRVRGQTIDQLQSKLVEASAGADISKIIAVLQERNAYEVFLPEESRCGMISARDILKITNSSIKPSALTSYVPTVTPESTVGEAARIMSDYRIRSVPVTDGRKIVAQVNSTTLLRELKGMNEAPVTSIATSDPITLDVADMAAKGRDLMVRKRIDHLPVKSDKRLAGVLTSAQLVPYFPPPERVGSKSKMPEHHRSLEIPAKDIMDANTVTCQPQATIAEALRFVLDAEKTYVLVTQWEEVQAIATHRDFMTLLAEVEPEPEVPVYIVGLPEDPFEAEVAKKKFKRTVNQLHKVFPDIIEARSVIRTKRSSQNKERGRYEVTVHVKTSKDTYAFEDSGWDLAGIYDQATDRFKRLLTQKPQHRKIRDRESREAP
jgi:CBS domain-containing protein